MLYQRFAVAGVANNTVLDAGLVSLVKEPHHIIAVILMCSEWQDNVIEGWIGTEKVLEVPDFLIDTNDDIATNPRSTNKLNRLEVEIDIEPGQIFKIGLRCGANATNIYGSYVHKVLPI